MLPRYAYSVFGVLIPLTVLAGEPEYRIDYDLLDAVEPIGESIADPQPAAGERLLLQFWASWCHSCGSLMWDLDELVENNAGIKYIAISLDDEEVDAREYISRHTLYEKHSDRYFFDAGKALSESLGVVTVPSIFLVDEKGNIMLRKSGHLNSSDLQDIVFANRSAR